MSCLALLVSLSIRNPAAPQMAVGANPVFLRDQGTSKGKSNANRMSRTKPAAAASSRARLRALHDRD